MLGSDYPFGIGDPDPCAVVEATQLTPAERRAILGDTAARIFHVECDLRRGGRRSNDDAAR